MDRTSINAITRIDPTIGRRRVLVNAALVGTGIALGGLSAPALAARPTLRKGSRGSAVKDLQNRLRSVMKWKGAADGIFGEQTRQAVIGFQRSRRLAADGIVGLKTWAALDNAGVAPAQPAPTKPAPTKPAPTKPAPKGSSRPTLKKGSSGAHVTALQKRLNALTYWVGSPDGRFGELTRQGVYAVQKVAGLRPDGVVGPKTWTALDRGVKGSSQITSGRGFDVHLSKQVLYAVENGRIKYTLNTSTGSGQRYYSGGRWKTATTPKGRFSIYRTNSRGWETGPLGSMYRPAYYDRGWAIHGSTSIPSYPASHGCSRITTSASDMLWAGGWFNHGRTILIR